MPQRYSRRNVIRWTTRAAASVAAAQMVGCAASGRTAARTGVPYLVTSSRPQIPCGVASGDVTASSGIVWARCDRPARMSVEYATTESLKDARTIAGPDASPDSDFTARADLQGLPADQRIFYRVSFADLSSPKLVSEPAVGSFRTAPLERRNVRFAWSGDTNGQGFGINPDAGGLRIYESIRSLQPEFFIHNGDTIYADQPIPAERPLVEGGVWKNITTPAKSNVAQTLEDFRGNHQYNLLDENLRRFN